MKKQESTKLFIITTYALFLIMLLITGCLVLGLKNDTVSTIAKQVCAWAPTITLFVLFPKLMPGTKRTDFVRSMFRGKIRFTNLFATIALQIAFLIVSVLLYSKVSGIACSQIAGCTVSSVLFNVLSCLTDGSTGEESGWRGYLQPIMVKRHGVVRGSIIVGIIWAFWHTPLWFLTSGFNGWKLVLYISLFIVHVVSSGVIIGINYEESHNILVPVAIHFTINFSTSFIQSNYLGVLCFLVPCYVIIAVLCITGRKRRLEKVRV